MSIVQNPLIGRAKQKMGGVVFTTWKGINVIKGKPLSVANPKTPNQLMRRNALMQIVAIGRTCKSVLDLGFKEQAVKKSSFNAFTGLNLRVAFDYSNAPDADIQFPNLMFSQGTISPTAVESAEAGTILGGTEISWTADDLGPGQSNSDQVKVVLHNRQSNVFLAVQSSELRSALNIFVSKADFDFNAGNTIDVYMSFFNVTNRKSSDTRYFSMVAAN